jgi:hypothetical protein
MGETVVACLSPSNYHRRKSNRYQFNVLLREPQNPPKYDGEEKHPWPWQELNSSHESIVTTLTENPPAHYVCGEGTYSENDAENGVIIGKLLDRFVTDFL